MAFVDIALDGIRIGGDANTVYAKIGALGGNIILLSGVNANTLCTLSGLDDPVSSQDATTKHWVLDQLSAKANLDGSVLSTASLSQATLQGNTNILSGYTLSLGQTNITESNVTITNGSSYSNIVNAPTFSDNAIFSSRLIAPSRAYAYNSYIMRGGFLRFVPTLDGQNSESGMIGYQKFTPGSLDIIGAGSVSGQRSIKLWDSVIVPGNISASNLAITGTVSGVTKAMVGLGSVDNTSDASKPVSAAQQAALDLKASLSGCTFTGTVALTGADIIQFGQGLTRHSDAGGIAYGKFTPGALDIVGGGTAIGNRTVVLYDNVTVNGALTAGGQTVVLANDARLSDARTPGSGSVTDASVSATANIAQSKIANLTSDLALKAPLTSPNFPGSVTAANITLQTATLTNIPLYNDNANAILGGLSVGALYRDTNGFLKIRTAPPLIDSTSLLLLPNNVSGWSSTSDFTGKPITSSGSPSWSSSGLVLNGSSWLSVAVPSDFTFGTGGVTIEAIFTLSGGFSTRTSIVEQFVNPFSTLGFWSARLYNGSNSAGVTIFDGTWRDTYAALTIAQGTQCHWAVVRNGSSVSLYFNGAQYGSSSITSSSVSMGVGTTPMLVGRNAENGGNITGTIHACRIIKTALYSGSTYTVPTVASIKSAYNLT